jgi:hypothetical protein
MTIMVRIVRRFNLSARCLPQLTTTAAILSLGVLNAGLVFASEALDSSFTPIASTTVISQSNHQSDRLPRRLANQVRWDLARRLGVSRRQLSIVGYSWQQWSDGCLELAAPDEFCTQAIVPGWRIELTDGEQTWVYHTDATGQIIRSQDNTSSTDEATLPEAVADRILAAAAQASGISTSDLKVVEAQPRIWDGCFGMAPPNSACTQIAIEGWQAIVTSPRESWVYHSNSNGSDVRLNETASPRCSPIVPSFISMEEQPYPGNDVVFQVVTEGGLTGRSSKILLLEDGQVVQFVEDRGVEAVTELTQISPRQVQAFEQRLQQHSFNHLNGLSYPAPNTADARTITLTARGGTTQYADAAIDQLPSALQRVIQDWEQLVSADLSE